MDLHKKHGKVAKLRKRNSGPRFGMAKASYRTLVFIATRRARQQLPKKAKNEAKNKNNDFFEDI